MSFPADRQAPTHVFSWCSEAPPIFGSGTRRLLVLIVTAALLTPPAPLLNTAISRVSNPLGPLGSSSSQHRRKPDFVLWKGLLLLNASKARRVLSCQKGSEYVERRAPVKNFKGGGLPGKSPMWVTTAHTPPTPTERSSSWTYAEDFIELRMLLSVIPPTCARAHPRQHPPVLARPPVNTVRQPPVSFRSFGFFELPT